MDSYSKVVQLEDEEPTPNPRNDDLLSMRESDVQSHPQFMIDEPIDAQLRFDLGSLDTRDLLDAQEPRESPWEFVRDEQGCDDDDATLLEHVKQDDNSQIDAQLFIDPQDNVNITSDSFASKVNNVSDLIENERMSSLSPASWINDKQKQQAEGEVRNENSIHEISSCEIMDSDVMQMPNTHKAYEGNSSFHISETIEIPQLSVQRLPAQRTGEEKTSFNVSPWGNTNALINEFTETQERKYVPLTTSLKDEDIGSVGMHSLLVHTRKEPQAEEIRIEHQLQMNALEGEDRLQDSPMDCRKQPETTALKDQNAVVLAEDRSLVVNSTVSHGNDEKTPNVKNASLGPNLGIVQYRSPDSEQEMALDRATDTIQGDGTEQSFAILVAIDIEKSTPELIAGSADEHISMSSHPDPDNGMIPIPGQESVEIRNKALEIQVQSSIPGVDDMNLSLSQRTASNETNGFVDSTSNNNTSAANSKDVLIGIEKLQSDIEDGENKEEAKGNNGQTCTPKSILPALLENMTVAGGASEDTTHISEGMPKKPTRLDDAVHHESQHDIKSGDTTILPGISKDFTTNSNKHLEVVNVSYQDTDNNAKAKSLSPIESGRHKEYHQEMGKDKNQSGGSIVFNDVNDETVIKALANDQNSIQDRQITLKPSDNIVRQADVIQEVSPKLSISHSIASTATSDIRSLSHEFASTIVSDVSHTQVKANKRRSNKLTDIARSSPVQVGSDEERRSTGKGGSGSLKGSPPRSGSSNNSSQRRRKGTSSSILQDSNSPALGTQGFQVSPNVKKAVSSGSSSKQKQHSLPDLNVGEAVISACRFNEQQQVQLRAQILVYGSLIQGGVPEEALMLTAFSSISGASRREGGNDSEGSGRALWEKTWRAAVERINMKSSDNTSKNAPGFLSLSARATDGSKSNSTPGTALPSLEGRNAFILNSKPQENWGKTTSKSSKLSGLPNPSISMGVHSISSSLGEAYINQSKSSKAAQPAAFLIPGTSMATQSITSQLGPFPPGAPQWVSPFPGPWLAQTQSTIHNPPSVLPRHPQFLLSSSQTLENSDSRKTSSASSLPVPVGPVLSTPVLGSLSVTGTDIVHKKHITTESRPRKRKKIDSEQPGSPLNVVPNANLPFGISPHVVHSLISTSTGQIQDSDPVSLVPTSRPTFSEPLAMVVAEKGGPNSFSERSLVMATADKVLGTNTEIQLGKSHRFQDLITHLEEAKASAEEASSVADTSVLESTSLWSQLKAQKVLGMSSDMEIQLVSSVIAATTAAAVAKAAAAAARAAYEAARHAKIIGENAFSSINDAYRVQPKHGQDSMGSSVSQPWKMPENCSSIIASAKIASKKRLESSSVAVLKAQNLELVVRAAELATSAVSQVGAVMAMGESVPFTLENLMEAGPEGLEMLLSLGSAYGKEVPKETMLGIQNDGKINAVKKTVSQGQECLLNKVNQSSLDFPSPLKELKETTALVRIDQPQNDTAAQVSIAGDVKHGNANTGNRIVENSLVEVLSDEEDLRGIWFSARVTKVEDQKVLVIYEQLTEDGTKPLEEWLNLEDSINEVPKVRLAHPHTSIGHEGTRKRKREIMGNFKWSVGDRIDAFFHDGWREGEIKEIVEDGETKVKVFFSGEGDTSLIKTSMIRPSLIWRNRQWVLWTDIKQASDVPFGGTQKVDTPSAKKQKREKSQAETGNHSKQVVEPSSFEKYEGGNHLDAASHIVDKTLTQDGINQSNMSDQPGSKAVLGAPKVAKKRKFMEVSKHYVSNKGSHIVDVKGDKVLAIIPSQIHTGSGESSKPDTGKSRKLLSSGQNDGHKIVTGKAQTKSSITRSSVDTKSKRKEELAPRLKGEEERPKESVESENQASTVRAMETSSMLEFKFRAKSTQANEKGTTSHQGKRSETKSVNRVAIKHERRKKTYKENDRQLRNQVLKSGNDRPGINKENEKSHPKIVKEGSMTKIVGKSGSKNLNLKVGNNNKDIGSENLELRRTSRKIQPTSKLLEGLQTAPSQSKSSSSQERGTKKG